MNKILVKTIVIAMLFSSCKDDEPIIFSGEFPVVLSTEAYFDPNMTDIEPEYNYNWSDPVKSGLLDINSYNPGDCNNYVRDDFGSRILSNRYDLHLGMDIEHCLSFNGENYDDGNPTTVFSMCDGVIDNIDPANKCSVYVICDQGFANLGMGENVEFVYRHLDEFDTDLEIDGRIEKGAPIGTMGTCEANLRHLHLSCVRQNPHKNIKVSRMFDVNRNAHFNRLDQGNPEDVDIRILESNNNSTIIRFALLGNKVTKVQLGIETEKYGNVYYNFEQVNYTSDGSSERDNPCFIDNICVYAYGFNGRQTACDIYESDKDQLPNDYPASAARGEGNYFPIECTELTSKVAFVYDFVLQGFNAADLEQELGKTFQPYVLGVFGDGIRVKN